MFRRLWRGLVRTGFRLLYNEMAWSYDVVSWVVSLGEWRKWQRAALPFVQGQRVLEIAHGPGHMLLALLQSGYRVTGLDLSPHMSRLASRRLRRGSPPEASQPYVLARGAAQALPFRANSFDTVLSTFPTNFIAQRATMASVHRVLRPGGRYLIVPEGRLKGNGPAPRLIAWLYQITGQSDDIFAVDEEEHWPAETPEWRAFRQAMAETGFDMEVKRVSLPRSEATVVVATRRP